MLLLGVAYEAQTAGLGLGDEIQIRPTRLSMHMGVSSSVTMRKAREACVRNGWIEYNIENNRSAGVYILKIP